MLVATALAIGVLALGIYSYISFQRALKEKREAERVRAMFSRYVSPTVVDEVLARKDPRLFEGRSGHATMLFCRIWNFALVSEDLEPAQTLRYLNEFYTLTGASIQKHRGMIDKFLGDGIMAVFGMPLDDPFQEEHALNAALDIVRLVAAMNGRWTAQGRKPIRIGIGISSGKVISGDTGYGGRREYTVVGTEVTIASRLQELTEEFGAFILAAASTFDPVREQFSGVLIKNIPIRGMRRVLSAFVIRGLARHAKDDKLLLPSAGAFRTTTVSDQETPLPQASAPITNGAPERQSAPPPAPPKRDESDALRRKKKKRHISTPPPDFAKQVEKDRFTAPAPEPKKSLEQSWAPPDYPFPPKPKEYAPGKIEIPEIGSKKHVYESAEPAMPELPGPPMTYEDGAGPPMQLPPS